MRKRVKKVHPLNDPAIKNLLQRMEPHIAHSFSLEQLHALSRVVGLRNGRLHSVDARTTVKLPFLPWTFYLVFLAGKNRRSLSNSEKSAATGMLLLLITCFCMLFTVAVMLVLYLLKSWLGINLFENFSLGLIAWVDSLVDSLR